MQIARPLQAFLLALALAPGLARAQEQQAPQRKPTSSEVDALLRGRNRSVAHPGSPLELSGRSPRDASAKQPVRVDAQANHARALAMYERRGEFHEPLPLVESDTEVSNAATRSAARRTSGAPAADAGGTPWAWAWAAALTAGILAAAWLLRRKSAPPRKAAVRT